MQMSRASSLNPIPIKFSSVELSDGGFNLIKLDGWLVGCFGLDAL